MIYVMTLHFFEECTQNFAIARYIIPLNGSLSQKHFADMLSPQFDNLEEDLAAPTDMFSPFLILTVFRDHKYFLNNSQIVLGFSRINEFVAKLLPIEVFMNLCGLICLLKARVD